MKKTKRRVLLSVTLLVLTFLSPLKVEGKEVQEVETKGTIGFSGTYVPIGKPDPQPPEGIESPPVTDQAKPGTSLPQTNDANQSWLVWLGISILSFVFIYGNKKMINPKKQ